MVRMSFRQFSIALTLLALTASAHADEADVEPRFAPMPKFTAYASLMYTTGHVDSDDMSAAYSSSNVPGLAMFLTACACPDVAVGGGTLAPGLYGDFYFGYNFGPPDAMAAHLSLGPQITYSPTDEYQFGVRYRAMVYGNLARDTGSGDDEYALDFLGRYRNTSVEVGKGIHLFSFPKFDTDDHVLGYFGLSVAQRLFEEAEHPTRDGAYYLRLDFDKFSPSDTRRLSGVELLLSIGWGMGAG
jgi:hypothetical protein